MTAVAKIRIMPLSVDTNLLKIKDGSKKIIERAGGKNPQFEEKPIAFGLKALEVFFLWEEEKELENLEGLLEKINGVKSIELIDIRRAIG